MSFPPPFTVASGSTDPEAPLVILCHGIGEDETMFDHVPPHLPDGVAALQVRGPVRAGRGFNWFERRDGRIHPPSLDEVVCWFEQWLDTTVGVDRPVVLVGFSAGSAFVGSLALRAPERYAGIAVLSGALPLTHLPAASGHLTGLPVFIAASAKDRVIPEEYTRDTWRYLIAESGAGVTTHVDPGEHEVSDGTAAALGAWVTGLREAPRAASGSGATAWTALPQGLPSRPGNRPSVAWAPPQQQWADQSDDEACADLLDRVRQLPGVELVEVRDVVPGQTAACVAGREFARLTPLHDTSVRVALPHVLARSVVIQGWGQSLPGDALLPRAAGGAADAAVLQGGGATTLLLVYGPRNKHELDVVAGIIAEAHHLASD